MRSKNTNLVIEYGNIIYVGAYRHATSLVSKVLSSFVIHILSTPLSKISEGLQPLGMQSEISAYCGKFSASRPFTISALGIIITLG